MRTDHTKVCIAFTMAMERDPLIEDSDDSDDEDYVVECEDNLPSEEEDDGEPEEDMGKSGCKRKTCQKKGRRKKTKVGRRRQSVTAVNDDDDDDDEANEKSEADTKLTEEDEKNKTDSLWSDFLQGTPKEVNNETGLNYNIKKDIKGESLREQKHGNTVQNMVTITNVFEFAGEEVKINKTVLADSTEAKNAAVGLSQQAGNAFPAVKAFGSKAGCKPLSGGGISAVLGKIGKKAKIGTLEKSKLDWERFKSSEGLEAEIQVHNRGRDGFLEKQDFLQRADVRQFEIEKQMRKITRSSR